MRVQNARKGEYTQRKYKLRKILQARVITTNKVELQKRLDMTGIITDGNESDRESLRVVEEDKARPR